MVAFKPAQSPPEVKIPILFMAPRVYEKSYEKLNNLLINPSTWKRNLSQYFYYQL